MGETHYKHQMNDLSPALALVHCQKDTSNYITKQKEKSLSYRSHPSPTIVLQST